MPIARRLSAVIAACAILLAAPALAADAAPTARQTELATKLFDAMHMDKTMASVTRAMAPALQQQFQTLAPNMTPAQRDAIAKATNDMMLEMTSKLTAEMVPVYAQTFTEKELSELLAFYQSQTGQSLLEKTPLVMSRLQPAMTTMMPEMMTKMRTRLCAELGCEAK